MDGNSVGVRGMTKLIAETDWEKCLRDAKQHQSTSVAAEISSSTSWLKLWDMALDRGQLGTLSANPVSRAIQALFWPQTLPSL